ncbi:MAG TPA: hypothetical protein VN258_00525 [Mobilitalea sp.]|nr:hypothetical protein [Mobilitalea sp.]
MFKKKNAALSTGDDKEIAKEDINCPAKLIDLVKLIKSLKNN